MPDEEKLKNALMVMVTDRNIRNFLKSNDPKALEQAEQALGDTFPEELRKELDERG